MATPKTSARLHILGIKRCVAVMQFVPVLADATCRALTSLLLKVQATFSEPGDYVIRLRVDNFLAADSKFDNVCCWSNAYVPVTVAP